MIKPAKNRDASAYFGTFGDKEHRGSMWPKKLSTEATLTKNSRF
jgi:hypothetical protein